MHAGVRSNSSLLVKCGISKNVVCRCQRWRKGESFLEDCSWVELFVMTFQFRKIFFNFSRALSRWLNPYLLFYNPVFCEKDLILFSKSVGFFLYVCNLTAILLIALILFFALFSYFCSFYSIYKYKQSISIL